MRLARYEAEGHRSFGFITGDSVVDATTVPGVTATTVREFIADHPAGGPIDVTKGAPTPLSQVTLLPPVELDKVVCAGVNYPTHREEIKLDEARPEYPVIFTRFPDSHVGPGEPLVKPAASTMFDYEGELAVVIGKPAWKVSVEQALDHVFGYTCYNDGSARDFQFHTHQWQPGKNVYRSGSIGPSIVTVDEIGDIGESWLSTWVDGTLRQRAQIKDMVHTIPELIAYISGFTPLRPGDVVATGTPGGVALFMSPQQFLEAGQVVEVAIDRVGVLRNEVVEEVDDRPGREQVR